MPKAQKKTAVKDSSSSLRSSPRKRKREPEDTDIPVESKLLLSYANAAKGSSRENQTAPEVDHQIHPKSANGKGLKTNESDQQKGVTKKAKKVSTIKEEKVKIEPIEEDTKRRPSASAETVKTPLKTKREASDDSDLEEKTSPAKKSHRKTKEEKAKDSMPLAARTAGLRMFVGAHVSMAKGIQNSVTNSNHIGGNAFALFLKSQRKWDNPPLANENRDAFHAQCQAHKYDASSHVLPHGSYLVNLAIEDSARTKQAYDTFLDDLQRCEALGIKLYNFHPGAFGQSKLPAAIKRIADNLNKALAVTKTVIPVLETMAGSGTVIGSRFTDLRDIISHIEPKYRHRVGVCIDTCHSFAAGYDLRDPSSFKAVLAEFDKVVGMQYLKALHLNDSKAPLDSKKDLHQNIGLGFLGLRAFHNVMNEPRFEDLPLILETPCDRPDPTDPSGKKTIEDKSIWATEIKLLEGLIGMDAGSKEFLHLEVELSEKGRVEREKMTKTLAERDVKKQKKLEKGQKTLLGLFNGGKGGKEAESKRKKAKVEGSESGSDAPGEGV